MQQTKARCQQEVSRVSSWSGMQIVQLASHKGVDRSSYVVVPYMVHGLMGCTYLFHGGIYSPNNLLHIYTACQRSHRRVATKILYMCEGEKLGVCIGGFACVEGAISPQRGVQKSMDICEVCSRVSRRGPR